MMSRSIQKAEQAYWVLKEIQKERQRERKREMRKMN